MYEHRIHTQARQATRKSVIAPRARESNIQHVQHRSEQRVVTTTPTSVHKKQAYFDHKVAPPHDTRLTREGPCILGPYIRALCTSLLDICPLPAHLKIRDNKYAGRITCTTYSPSFCRNAIPPGCSSAPTMRSGSASERSIRHILSGLARFVFARACASEEPATPAPTMTMS